MAQINKPAQPLVPPTTDADVENIVAEAIASDDTHAALVNGEVPSDQLPSYVDDVLEFESTAAFPAEGEVGKIYVALDTNYTYRWSGAAYVQVGGASLGAGDGITIANDLVSADETYLNQHLEFEAPIADLADIRSGAALGATAAQPADLATKQDIIDDLATIRSGAALGATAVQPAALEIALADDLEVVAYQTQNPLSAEQLAKAEAGKLAIYKDNFVYTKFTQDGNVVSFQALEHMSENGTYTPGYNVRIRRYTLTLDRSTRMLNDAGYQQGVSVADTSANFLAASAEPAVDSKELIRGLNLRQLMLQIAPFYKNQSTIYEPGAVVWHGTTLYRCITRTQEGEWDSSYWTSLEDLNEQIAPMCNAMGQGMLELYQAIQQILANDIEIIDYSTQGSTPLTAAQIAKAQAGKVIITNWSGNEALGSHKTSYIFKTASANEVTFVTTDEPLYEVGGSNRDFKFVYHFDRSTIVLNTTTGLLSWNRLSGSTIDAACAFDANTDPVYPVEKNIVRALNLNKTQNMMSARYSASATYAVGDYCIYHNDFYRCTTAITAAEAWTAAHWTKVTISDELLALAQGGGSGGMTNPMTAAGDLIVGGSAGAPTRLAAGSNGQVLGISSGAPAWINAAAGDGTPHYIIENNDLVDEAGQPVDITSFGNPTTVLLTINTPNNDSVYDVGTLKSIYQQTEEGIGDFDHLEVRTNHGLISITQGTTGDLAEVPTVTRTIEWSGFQVKKPQYTIDEEGTIFVGHDTVQSLSDLPNQQNGQTIDLILFLPSNVTKTTEARMRWSLDDHDELDHVLVQTLKYGDIILRQNPDSHSENPILIDWSESYVFYDSPIIRLNFNENLVEDVQQDPLNLVTFGNPSHVTIALNTGNDVPILIPAVITANEGAWMILAGEHGTIMVTPNEDPKSETPYILDWSNFSYHPELCLGFRQDTDDVHTFPGDEMPDLIPISVPTTFTALVILTSGLSMTASAMIVPQENAWMVVLGDHGFIALTPDTDAGDGYLVDWSNFIAGGDAPSPEPFDPSTLPTLTINPSSGSGWSIDKYPTDLPQTLPLGPLTPNIKLLLRLDDDNIEEQFGIMLSDKVTIHLLDDQFNLLPEAKLVLGTPYTGAPYKLYTSHVLARSDYQTQSSNSPYLGISFEVCHITDGEEIVYTPGE